MRFLKKVLKAEFDFINNDITIKEFKNKIFSDDLSCEADDEGIKRGFCGEDPEEFLIMETSNFLRLHDGLPNNSDKSKITNVTTKIELCNDGMACNFKILYFLHGNQAFTDVVTLNSDSSKVKDIRLLNDCNHFIIFECKKNALFYRFEFTF